MALRISSVLRLVICTFRFVIPSRGATTIALGASTMSVCSVKLFKAPSVIRFVSSIAIMLIVTDEMLLVALLTSVAVTSKFLLSLSNRASMAESFGSKR